MKKVFLLISIIAIFSQVFAGDLGYVTSMELITGYNGGKWIKVEHAGCD